MTTGSTDSIYDHSTLILNERELWQVCRWFILLVVSLVGQNYKLSTCEYIYILYSTKNHHILHADIIVYLSRYLHLIQHVSWIGISHYFQLFSINLHKFVLIQHRVSLHWPPLPTDAYPPSTLPCYTRYNLTNKQTKTCNWFVAIYICIKPYNYRMQLGVITTKIKLSALW